MKKIFSLGTLSFSAHIKMYLVLLVQILLILCGMNVLLASYQQQAMLEEPFSDLLQYDGYYITMIGSTIPGLEDPVIEQLEGEKETINFPYYVCNAQCVGQTIPIQIFIYEDSFWASYHPVLQHGTWMSADKQGDHAYCVVTSNCPGKEIIIPGISVTAEASGILSTLTYIPQMNRWSRNGGLDENFYRAFDAASEETVILLMPRTQWEKLAIPKEQLVTSSNCILYFTSLTDEQAEHNAKVLEDAASPGILLSTLRERVDKAQIDTTRRYLPLLIALLLITVFGIMCAMAIHLLQDLHSYAIYFLCGMRWRKCAELCAVQLGFLLILALAVCATGYFVLQMTEQAAVLGLRFTWINIVVSLGLCTGVLFLGSLFPRLILKNHAPITLLRSTES
ncbi:MAG: hypothetical protein K2I93_06140 [Oscillospiraceae bacterium]|nr:hypothetical protein [Oscillospiraceae bacterium]